MASEMPPTAPNKRIAIININHEKKEVTVLNLSESEKIIMISGTNTITLQKLRNFFSLFQIDLKPESIECDKDTKTLCGSIPPTITAYDLYELLRRQALSK